MNKNIFLLIFVLLVVVAGVLFYMRPRIEPIIYSGNIINATTENNNWRKVVYTDPQMQIALMNVPPGQELGREVHKGTTQFFHIVSGSGKLYVTGKPAIELRSGTVAAVPADTEHNIIANDVLKLYTIYAPSHHPPGTIDRTKSDELGRN